MNIRHDLPHNLLRAFHRDEKGTTITEFVVVLPVFVLIFGATLALSRLQHTGIETQITASSQMWTSAIAVQTDTNTIIDPNLGNAQLGAIEAQNVLNMRNPSPKTDGAKNFMVSRWQAVESNGHMGDAQAMLQGIQTHMPANMGLDQYNKLYTAHTRYNEQQLALSDSVGDLFDPTQQRAAFNLLNDAPGAAAMPNAIPDQLNPAPYILLDSSTDEGTIYTSALTSGSSRLSLSTGIRYGIAHSNVTRPVLHSMLPSGIELSAGFDTLLAPRPALDATGYQRTNYISHMTLMNESLYSTLLAIDYKETLAYDTSY